MKLNQAVSSTLLVAITEALQQGEMNEYGWIDFQDGWEASTLEAVDADFAKNLKKALDGRSLTTFLREQLRVIQLRSNAASPKAETPLTKIKCFAEPLKVARRVVQALESIPTQYRMIVQVCSELSQRLSRTDFEIKLSDQLRLLSGERIPSSFRTEHNVAAIDKMIRGPLLRDEIVSITDNALYLEYRTSGYLSTRRPSKIVGDFYDEIRAFYGACVAHNIISTMITFGTEEIQPYIVADSIVDDVENFAYFERAEEDVTRCANLATTRATDSDIDKRTDLQKVLAPVLKVFASPHSTKLKTACAWNLRAHLSSRDLDKVLESAITIEVLMGDRDTSDRIGLTKLIANRCAYALGKSTDERDEITNFFVQFYRVRSEVVHSGRTTLHAEERKIVNEGLQLATRILKHEVSLAA